MTSTMPPPPPSSAQPPSPPRSAPGWPSSASDRRARPPRPPLPPPEPRPTAGRHSPIGVLFTILAIGLAVVTIAYGMASILNALAIRTYHETSTFPLVDDLVLRGGEAEITLIADATDEITVDTRVRRGLVDARPAASLQGGQLVLDGGCRSMFDSWCSVDVTVHVPRRINLLGGVEDGVVRAEGLTGTIDLRVADGRLELTEMDADTVSLRAADGRVDLSLASAPTSISVRTGDGAAAICLPEDAPAYSVTVARRDGSVRVDVPDDPRSSRPMALSTIDGRISARLCPPAPAD